MTEKKIREAVTLKKCGLCGKSDNLARTACCNNWICNDEHKYVIFSYARNSCHRNHDRYTLCAFHYHNDHDGDWKTCKECKKSFETEIYVDFGTNQYNFEKLENPPKFKPQRCARCKASIFLSRDGYTMVPKEGYVCENCYPHHF